jgi:hypothetical protein
VSSARRKDAAGSEAERLRTLRGEVHGLTKDLTRLIGEARTLLGQVDDACARLATCVRAAADARGDEIIQAALDERTMEWSREIEDNLTSALREMRQRFRELQARMETDVSHALGADLDTVAGIIRAARTADANGAVPAAVATRQPMTRGRT